MPRPAVDYTGVKSGYLTFLFRSGTRGTNPVWRVRCVCGTEKDVLSGTAGRTLSCGCMRGAAIAAAKTTHGQAGRGEKRSRVYRIWNAVKNRCHNPNQPHYPRYGGLGTKVCREWQDSFEAFYEHMGDPPSDQHSIDRIDPWGNYEPGNCRWATRLEQARNKRKKEPPPWSD